MGVSWYHYVGQTTALLASLQDRTLHHNDTLLRFEAGQVTSIDIDEAYRGPRITLHLIGDSSITICGIKQYADSWPTQLDDFQRWLGSSFVICTEIESVDPKKLWWHLPIICPSEIEEDVRFGRPVTITRYSPSLLPRLNSYGNILRDLQ
jgi:hypothetical protein